MEAEDGVGFGEGEGEHKIGAWKEEVKKRAKVRRTGIWTKDRRHEERKWINCFLNIAAYQLFP